MQVKIDTPVDRLCSEIPAEFGSYLTYCRGLRFEEEPDYNYVKHLFRECMRQLNHDYDFEWDWLSQDSLTTAEERKEEAKKASN